MKKIIRSIILALLVVTFLLSSIACSCNEENEEGNTGGQSTYAKVDYTTGIDFDKAPLKIVENRVDKYSIVLSSTASTMVNSVAIELNEYISSVSGAKLKVVNDSGTVSGNYISLGDTAQFEATDLDISKVENDGFIIKTIDGNIYINSNMDEGIMFGVYSFLERFLGIRWLTEDTTHVPKSDDINVYPCDILEEPEFARRVWYDAGSGVTSFYNHRRYFEDLDAWFYPGWTTPHNTTDYPDVGRRSIGYVNKWDVVDATTGKYLRNYDTNLGENETYLKDYHPEYFTDLEAYDADGNFKPATPANGEHDICFTNGLNEDGSLKSGDSVIQYIVDKIKTGLTKDAVEQRYKYIHVAEMDNGNAICNCKTCIDRREKYKGGGVVVMFINAIEREVNTWLQAEQGRTVTFSTFAYHTNSVTPPVIKDENGYRPISDACVANDNVQVRVAPIGADYTYSFKDENQIEKYHELFDGWDVCTKAIRVWDYTIDFYAKTWWYPNLHYLKENYIYYKDHGCVEIFSECAQGSGNQNFWTDSLKSYVVSKLYWNFGWDVAELVDEFIELYYGVSAPTVKKYLNTLDGHYAELRATIGSLDMLVVKPGCNFYNADKYPKNFLTGLVSLIEDEMLAVSENESLSEEDKTMYIGRLKKLKLTPMAMIFKNYGTYYSIETKEEYAKEFLTLCDECGVVSLEWGKDVAELKAAYGLA